MVDVLEVHAHAMGYLQGEFAENPLSSNARPRWADALGVGRWN